MEALKGRERVDLFVLLPKGRVSDVQRLFMTATGAPNVHAIEIDGDFDACQAIVKSMFADREFAQARLAFGRQLDQLGAHRRAERLFPHRREHAWRPVGR